MLTDNYRDAIHATITVFKKLTAKHWVVMKDADIEVVVRSIHDVSGVYLCQTLMEGGIDVVEAVQEVPPLREFLRSLPKKCRCEEEKQLTISALHHASEAHTHVSTMCTHISSLTKVSDKEMVNLVLHAVGRPLMQLNIPKRFVNLAVDARLKAMEEEQ